MINPRLSSAKKLLVIIFSTMFVLGIIKIYFLDIYKISSDSMKNKFQTNTYILISKYNHNGLTNQLKSILNSQFIPKRNEIYVFKIKQLTENNFVKRCVGLPGDWIELRNSKVFVNNSSFLEPKCVKHYYKVWYNDYTKLKSDLENACPKYSEEIFRRFSKFIFISLDYAQKLRIKNGIDSIVLYNPHLDPDSNQINFPELNINILKVPLYQIPFKGMKVLFSNNIPFPYIKAIRMYEDSTFAVTPNSFLVHGKPTTSYIFRKDYIFFLGDNRDIAFDSRHYGVIPIDNIIGQYIYDF